MFKSVAAFMLMFSILSEPSLGAWWDCIKVFSVQPKTEIKSSRLSGTIADLAYSIKRLRYLLDLQSLAKSYPNVVVLGEMAGLSIKDFRRYPGLQQIDEFFKQVAINLEAKDLGPINFLKSLGQGNKTILAEIEILEKRIAERDIKVTWKTQGDQDTSNVSGKLISVLTGQAITKEPIPTLLSTINHELDHSVKDHTVSRETDLNDFADSTTIMMIDDEVRVRLLQIKYDQHLIDVGILKNFEGTGSSLNEKMMKVLIQSEITQDQRASRVRAIVEADYYMSTFENVVSYWMAEQTRMDIKLIGEWIEQKNGDSKEAYSLLRSSPRRVKMKSLAVRDQYDKKVISEAAEKAGESKDYINNLVQKILAYSSNDPQ